MSNKATRGSRGETHETASASPASLRLFAFTMAALSLGSLLLGASYLLPPSVTTGLLKGLVTDEHYKYLIPLLVPTTAWFVIANWVGWQYFRFA